MTIEIPSSARPGRHDQLAGAGGHPGIGGSEPRARALGGPGRPARRLARSLAWMLTAGCLVVATAPAVEIAGVQFPERHEWNGESLRLHGVGLLRYRRLFKGYAAALYLGDQVEPERALDDVPRRLEIEYFWSIPAEAFAKVTLAGISRNVDAETLARLSKSIARLNELYEDVRPGDRYSLTYVPGVGTELALNGDPKGLVEGADFSSALFAIWLGEEALDERLRDRLLVQR